MGYIKYDKEFTGRKYFFYFLFGVIGFIFIVKLFSLQILEDKYLISSQNNTLRHMTIYPSRGLIYDRNGKIIVHNEAAYDLMIVPKQVNQFDTAELCSIINVEKEFLKKRISKAIKYSRHIPSICVEQISKEEYAILQEKLHKFKGFFVQNRTYRKYPFQSAANTLGYIGEVSQKQIEADGFYKSGDYIGISGLERTYEKELRGQKGEQIMLVDVNNIEQGSFEQGEYDVKAVKGNDLYSCIDIELQTYGEELMQNKKGSIVAIEPETGEIICIVTSPAYDPNVLVGRQRGKYYDSLQSDPAKPLFNRALKAQYPPGSPFKLVNALCGLEYGIINQRTKFVCHGVVNRPIRCSHNHISPLGLLEGIEQSCNSYFWNTFSGFIKSNQFDNVANAYENWYAFVAKFHIGQSFESDLFNMSSGFLPPNSYYDHYYKKGHWNQLTVRSLSIGQGELLVTPLHLANISAIIANRGFYVTPHLIKSIDKKEALTYKKNHLSIQKEHFETVVNGMNRVFEGDHGTAKWYRLPGITMCGKTGTAENPHGDDHSIFIAFAPKDKPKIAISVVVENSGYGSTWAVPITSLMIEKYLTDSIRRPALEERMINGNLLE